MKHVLIILSTLLIFSCGTAKKIKKDTKSSEKAVVSDTISRITDITKEASIETIIQEVKSEDENIVIQVTTYDTTKPVNEATNRPPVASETTITKNKKITEQKESSTKDNSEQKIVQQEQAGFRSEIAQDSTSVVLEEPVPEKSNNAVRFVRAILFILIVLLLIYFRKPIKGFLGLFKSN